MVARDERSVYVTNINAEVTEDLLKELFLQVGPVETVFLKKNEGVGRDFALIAFEDEESVPFAVETLDEVKLYNMPLSVKPKGGSEQEKSYRRRQDEQRLQRTNVSTHLPPPPLPPSLLFPNVASPPFLLNGAGQPSLMSIPYGPGGVHPSAMAGYNTPPGYNGPPSDHYRGSMHSLVSPSPSTRNSYDRGGSYDRREWSGGRDNGERRSEGGRSYERRDERRENDRWNYGSGGGGGRRDYRDDRNSNRYNSESTPNRQRDNNNFRPNQYGNGTHRRF